MAKAKIKNVVQEKTVRKHLINDRPRQDQGQDLDSQKVVQFWQEELRSLKGEEFPNVEEAVAAIIGKVIERLKVPQNEQMIMAQFLEDMFCGDEGMKEKLVKGLAIKG